SRRDRSVLGALLAPLALVGFLGLGCGEGEAPGQQLCALCQTPGGSCELGCCAYPEDPVALCQAYVDALCARGRACAPAGTEEADLMFCGLDCSQASTCEQIFLSAFPDELGACQDSLAQAACDPGEPGVFVAGTPACVSWEAQAEAAVEDSSCREDDGREGSGTSRVAPALPPS
ncbi:MAG TPA: hypothetical protein P5076_25685, partial [Myxococcota bacterium]|nr:hypothetical protein [Myxococcota bacterium]